MTGVNFVGVGEEEYVTSTHCQFMWARKYSSLLWYIHSQKLISYGTFSGS